jgi:hypothetical protein
MAILKKQSLVFFFQRGLSDHLFVSTSFMQARLWLALARNQEQPRQTKMRRQAVSKCGAID